LKERYQVLTIVTAPPNGDALTGILYSQDCLGFQEEESGGKLKVSAWFTEDVSSIEERIQAASRELNLSIFECSTSFQEYDPEEWLENFSRSFSGIDLEGVFFIHPPWVEPSPDVPVNILLEPGHAFGTGTHESTQLALLALHSVLPGADSFLDVGTGSGILAAAAGKINPGLDITICDIDSMAVESAVETLANNGIEEITAVTGGPEAFSGRDFQVVAANLTSPVLISLQEVLTRLASEFLVISGITAEQRDYTLEKFLDAGFELEGSPERNGWVSCLLRKA